MASNRLLKTSVLLFVAGVLSVVVDFVQGFLGSSYLTEASGIVAYLKIYDPDISRILVEACAIAGISFVLAMLFRLEKFKTAGREIALMLKSRGTVFFLISCLIGAYLNVYRNLGEIAGIADALYYSLHPNGLLIIFIYGITYGVYVSAKANNVNLSEWIYKWRWLIAGIILAGCVCFELNGSSLHEWVKYTEECADGVLFGISRYIRSDEWARMTPIRMAQAAEKFPALSNIIRGYPTWMGMSGYAHHLSAMYAPFGWGYLFMDFSHGLSFYWCSRLIILFMVMFEVGMLFKLDKGLSCAFAAFTTLAPVVQWWFSAPLAEMMIFGFGAVLLGKAFLTTDSLLRKIACAYGIITCAGGYVLTLYPAWMIPMAYIIVGFMVWVIIEERENIQFRARVDLPIIIIALAALGLTLFVILYEGKDMIMATLNTVYPGKTRVNHIMSMENIYDNIFNVTYPYTEKYVIGTNLSEGSSFIGLFPVGIITAVIGMLRAKKLDWLSIVLFILSAFFFVFAYTDTPEYVRNITMMNFTMSLRVVPFFDMVQMLLLFRSFAIQKKECKWYYAVPLGLLTAVLSWYHFMKLDTLMSSIVTGIVPLLYIIVVGMVFSLGLMSGANKLSRKALICVITLAAFIGGGMINPVQRGVDEIEKNNVLGIVEDVVAEDSEGLWIVDNLNYPYANLPMMVGAPTVNSMQEYPCIERWEKLGIPAEQEYFYNRFAVQITVSLVNDEETNFSPGVTEDILNLHLNTDDLLNVNVRYIFTNRDLETLGTVNVSLEKISEYGVFKVYKVCAMEL